MPFELDEENWRLNYVFADESLRISVSAKISDASGKLKIEISDGKNDKNLAEKILRDTRHIMRLDENLSDFYSTL